MDDPITVADRPRISSPTPGPGIAGLQHQLDAARADLAEETRRRKAAQAAWAEEIRRHEASLAKLAAVEARRDAVEAAAADVARAARAVVRAGGPPAARQEEPLSERLASVLQEIALPAPGTPAPPPVADSPEELARRFERIRARLVDA